MSLNRTKAFSILKCGNGIAWDYLPYLFDAWFQGWPEAINRVIDYACNAGECSKVRCTAMGVISQVLAALAELKNADSPLLMDCEGLQAALMSIPQNKELWEMVRCRYSTSIGTTKCFTL